MAGHAPQPAGLGHAVLLVTLRGQLRSFGGWFCSQNCSRTPLHLKGFLEGSPCHTGSNVPLAELALKEIDVWPSRRFLAEHKTKGKDSFS